MGSAWTSALAVRVPATIATGKTIVGELVTHFCERMHAALRGGVNTPAIFHSETQRLQGAFADAESCLHAFYRDVSSMPLNSLRGAMLPCYQRCAAESGFGCRDRMGHIVNTFLHTDGERLFADIEATARARLVAVREVLSRDLEREFEAGLTRIEQLYAGITAPKPGGTRRARVLLQELLRTADEAFSLSVLERGGIVQSSSPEGSVPD